MLKKLVIILLMLIACHSLAIGQSADKPFLPGRAILISTYPDTSSLISGKYYMVNDVGEINLPIIGKLQVSNLDKESLIKILKTSYAKYVRSVNYQVDCYYRISLLGGFENPGLYYARPDETLWEVVRKTGGFLGKNGFKKMTIFRGNDKFLVSLADEYSLGKTLRELGIDSGDVITVPIPPPAVDGFSRFAQILGIVTTGVTVYFSYVTLMLAAQRGR